MGNDAGYRQFTPQVITMDTQIEVEIEIVRYIQI